MAGEGRSGDRALADALRERVDRAGGSLHMGVRELRDGFGRGRLTDRARSEIGSALDAVGLATDPPLRAVDLNDRVVLYVAERQRPSVPPRQQRRSAPPGWYRAPDDARLERWWDGSRWTDASRWPGAAAATGSGGTSWKRAWTGYRRLPTWLQWAAPIFVAFVLIAAFSEDPADNGAGNGAESSSAEDRERERARERERDREAERERERKRERRERRRKRRERQQQSPPATPAPEPEPDPTGCDPNYSGCVPEYPPDVNCPEVDGPVTVTGSDPHGLDRDDDGRACE